MGLTVDKILESENLKQVLEHLLKKKNSCGSDGVYVDDFSDFWNLNKEKIIGEIKNESYIPGIIQEREIVLSNGKRRKVMNCTCTDRMILRAIAVKMQEAYESCLSQYSFAYRKNRGTLQAVEQAAEYIRVGKSWIAEVDIKSYFDNINLEKLNQMLETELCDKVLYRLIKRYLYCKIQSDCVVYDKTRGIVQGSPLSPLLSNLYLNEFDKALEQQGWSFCRFADNINIYTESREQAAECFEIVKKMLEELDLSVNESKSGIFPAVNRVYLGYGFEYHKKNQSVLVKKITKKQHGYYKRWHPTAIHQSDKQYHIVNGGILTKRDYTLLFENDTGKRYLPVETTEGLSIYSNVIFNSGFFEFAGNHNLRISMYNQYGKFIGAFYPEKHALSARLILKQASLYNDELQRLNTAKKIIMAAAHNMRANLRYYKKQGKDFEKEIRALSAYIVQMNEASDIQSLMLIEARCRQKYYQCWDKIIETTQFEFNRRTKRPPENAVNAMISFGNVFLYEMLAKEIIKASLDVRIGILHSTNRRNASLNLDIAEIFKPLIVDRVIFKMINRKLINEEDFEKHESDGIYLNKEGKQIFIKELYAKLNTKLKVKEKEITYEKLMREEVQKLYRMLAYDENYVPYKYY